MLLLLTHPALFLWVQRAPWHMVHMDGNNTVLSHNSPNLRALKMTLDECVEASKPECVFSSGENLYDSELGSSHYSQVKSLTVKDCHLL